MIEKLRPGVTNSKYWNPERPPKKEWSKIRKTVLERDNYTCQYCSHKAIKFMNIHHLDNPEDNEINNLINENSFTVPTTIEKEIETNPFLRADNDNIKKNLNMHSASSEEIFGEIRKRKDNF